MTLRTMSGAVLACCLLSGCGLAKVVDRVKGGGQGDVTADLDALIDKHIAKVKGSTEAFTFRDFDSRVSETSGRFTQISHNGGMSLDEANKRWRAGFLRITAAWLARADSYLKTADWQSYDTRRSGLAAFRIQAMVDSAEDTELSPLVSDFPQQVRDNNSARSDYIASTISERGKPVTPQGGMCVVSSTPINSIKKVKPILDVSGVSKAYVRCYLAKRVIDYKDGYDRKALGELAAYFPQLKENRRRVKSISVPISLDKYLFKEYLEFDFYPKDLGLGQGSALLAVKAQLSWKKVRRREVGRVSMLEILTHVAK